MQVRIALAALALITAPAVAQSRSDPDKPVQGGGTLRAGWSARTDRNAAMTNVKFETMGATGLHVTTGPAVILWRATDKATGGYHVNSSSFNVLIAQNRIFYLQYFQTFIFPILNFFLTSVKRREAFRLH